jgi:hypothetical protein
VQARVAARPEVATREERQAFWTSVMRGEEGAEMSERLKASELLGKSQLDFKERVEVEVTANPRMAVRAALGLGEPEG